MQTVYLDVLFCVNFIIDYLMLISVRTVLSLRVRRLRLLLASALGGIGAFVLLLPPLPFAVSVIISLSQACLMIAAAFLPLSKRTFLKAAILLFGISFCFCGAVTAILTFLRPKHTLVRNSAVYIGISPLLLIALTLLCYLLLRGFYALMNKGVCRSYRCEAVIDYQGKTLTGKGMIDTGNTLHEPFSGKCVIVGREDVFRPMLDAGNYLKTTNELPAEKGVRLIPFDSVGGSGLMPAIHPAGITIRTEKTELQVDAYLALSHHKSFAQDCDLIVPAELIMKGS